ncbi:aminotransferase class V-fold PLP-dependent enzyme [Galbitalea sp. SE-J8]|uniref:aminotransferase class V-fold PLP-dependent enzyme n=1 Tax=Galbitalea sp. SE-J8 TaxID=3054952 RepID=UPI00259CC52E|nr:aminotransferase class V-fold PLP-dependent enzyme [Galbitalea sp. SE-J8]MDM4763393.1 aminotransferase class V-fold PLP-dependent enzyme [Galbitalea sp. SE-J8]
MTDAAFERYLDSFDEEPGYLDFAFVGPMGAAARGEQLALTETLARARFGTVPALLEQDERARAAVAAVTGFRADQVVFQPNTSQGLMQALFGITGTVALAPSEFPSLPFAAVRAHEALGALEARWLETDAGRVTPGGIRAQLDDSVVAVAVSLVDFRTGYLVDLEGIRQVIGDRLLVVDAIQGFGVVDAPWGLADVIATGGQKWLRAGWSTGFLALSDRAVDRLTPVLSGFPASEVEGMPLDAVPPPARGARAFEIAPADPIAQARLAAALEQLAEVGVGPVRERIVETTERIIQLADEFAVPVLSSRAPHERAGIVVLGPEPAELTALAAALHNHGVATTVRAGTVRVSAHASTTDETLDLLRAALTSYATAI